MENRLDDAASPYLRQHADNPVAWQPWDEKAWEVAARRDVPVFLSIGYAACHWCHVMEEESFEDPAVAALLNAHFVPIKVDREERPDVDSVYMQVCQLVTGSGGWPLSVWLTPDREPFHVGTYFPPEPQGSRPSFSQVLEELAQKWDDPEGREEIESQATQWTQALEQVNAPADSAPTTQQHVVDQSDRAPILGSRDDPEVLDHAAQALIERADRRHGGWGTGQKFPHSTRIHLLLAAAKARGAGETTDEALDECGRAVDPDDPADYQSVALETLDSMAHGGLYDHLGGGFHRYCVDRDWTVPHFEKMLYDNAEIPRAFLAGYQVTGREAYADVVRQTFAFLDRELTHPDGGLYATLDAQSMQGGSREEGAYYVWQPEEVRAAVADPLDATCFNHRYGVTEDGNFEGATVLRKSASIEAVASANDMSTSEAAACIDRAREACFGAREERPAPPRDEKILAGWNGLAIAALAEGALVLDPDYATQAMDALEFCREQLWDGETLYRRFEDGQVGIPGYLDDYAYLGRGALDAYSVTGDVTALAFAVDLASELVDSFYDPDTDELYLTGEDANLPTRPRDQRDDSTPSSTGVAVDLLQRLAHFVPDADFKAVAAAVLDAKAGEMSNNPLTQTTLALAAHRRRAGFTEVTVSADGLPESIRKELATTYLPHRLLSVRPPTDSALDPWLNRLDLDATPPIWAGRDQHDNEPTVYVCQNEMCSPPAHTISDALDGILGD